MRRSKLTRCVFPFSLLLLPAAAGAVPMPIDELPTVTAGQIDPVSWPELWINGSPTGEFVRAERVPDAGSPESRFLLEAVALRALGVMLAPAEVRADGQVALWQLPDVRASHDQSGDRLLLTLPLSRLSLNRFNADPALHKAQAASRGLLLNYDILTQHDRPVQGASRQRTAGFGELRWFGATGYFSQTATLRMDEEESSQLLRLDSNWRYSAPDSLWTLQVGDAVSAGLDSQNAYRFGGVQWRRNFALRPDLVIFPVPVISGSSAVPATVDVLLDNIRQYSQQVPAGPFEIDRIPFSTTTGDMRVVVRDVLGREQETMVPLYSVIDLLRPGLVDFAVQAGWLRRDYALRSNSYGDQAASAAVRYGVAERLTVSAHAEVMPGLRMGGGGAAVALGRWSTLSLSQAASRGRDAGRTLDGRRSRVAWQYQSVRGLSLSASRLQVDEDFRDIASNDLPSPIRRLDQVGTGASFGNHGSLGANLVATEQHNGSRERFVNVSYSRALGGEWHAYISWNRGLDGARQDAVFIGLSWYPRTRLSVDGSVSLDRGEPAEYALRVQQRREGETGLGWSLRSRTGGDRDTSWYADAGWRGDYGESAVQVEQVDGDERARLSHNGSLVLIGGGVHAGRRINQSFAVVDVGLPEVPVRLENRIVGRTGGGGQYMVTDLRPYQRNRLSIDAIDIPAGYVVRDAVIDVVPPEQAGVHVTFPVSAPQAAVVVIVDEAGTPLPVGAQGRLGDGRPFVVGYGGEVYLEEVLGRAEASVIHDNRRCLVQLDIPRGGLERRDALPPAVCRDAAGAPATLPARSAPRTPVQETEP